jgi:hypothetical protein
MADLIYVGVIIAFFALSMGLVRICEWIVGGTGVTEVDFGDDAEARAESQVA